MTDSKTKDLIESIRKIGRRRTPTQEFANLLEMMNVSEEQRQANIKEELNANYAVWANHFEMLKTEFNALWDFFKSIEKESEGWFCVSPFLNNWNAVGHTTREGYVFGVSIMKNHQRNAPLSEKSLAVTFGVEEWGGGIGDEREIGRMTKIDDQLCGLIACTGKSQADQYQGSKKLYARVGQGQLQFRLNHRDIGQETSRLGLDILDKHSLVELAEKLFVLLNKDLLNGLNKELAGLSQKAIDKK